MGNFVFYSYLTAAIAYFLLLLFAIFGTKKNNVSISFIVAVAFSLFWAACITFTQYSFADGFLISDSLAYETLRNAAWFFVLGTLISRQYYNNSYQLLFESRFTYLLTAFMLFLFAFEISQNFRNYILEIIGQSIKLRLLSHLSFAIIGLALVEQLYRNATTELRWVIKFLCIGLGSLFTVDFIVYSKSLLFTRLDYSLWSSRGVINALIVPLLALAWHRSQTTSMAGITLSRQIVFHSTVLMGTGFYLILMSLAGFYIRDFGGTWGEFAEIVFIFLAILLLLVLFLSGKVRALVKIFFNKHFFSYSYDYREEWLKLSKTIAQLNSLSDLSSAIITAMSDLVDSSGGGLWLKDDQGDFYLAETQNIGVELPQNVTANHSILHFMVDKEWVIDLYEFADNPDIYEGADLSQWCPAEKNVWLIIPLFLQNDLEAFVVLTQARVPRALNWEDHDLLKTVGKQLANALALNRASDALSRSRQFEAYNRLSAYLVHDLKNLIAQIALIVKNAEKHKRNPEFVDDAIITLENVVNKMEHLITQLKKGHGTGNSNTRLNLSDIAADVAIQQAGNKPVLQLIKSAGSDMFINGEKEKLTAILGHLVQNAQDATPDNGAVKMELSKTQQHAVIKILDSGCGMDKKFIAERLFKPFDTTKGNAGMGIGVYEARDYIVKHSGTCQVDSKPGIGTTFTITLPLADDILLL
ncbi:MAG: PEP-CTERM system histidine kinase PrsK [Methylovulum sp.]|uniref:XrtA/PEP-CTERM system histidine kinase PrsK n=1 Tax=Methylovulum sp. TaxID=1916980 RepID=UPI0026331744|nr:XrtA/PEP-CTERM system histidine kinase PrsK [Methylovulum sp.]MDD2725013.1 PEP-CTERM system histidine kinase PrsK [Methylovulum sp.]MDD5126345.1 PEP-CTERM system histidine kinase PrsK [Methylovulum sp.]